MQKTFSGKIPRLLIIVTLAAVICAAALWRSLTHRHVTASNTDTGATTQSVKVASSKPATAPSPTPADASYLDVIRAAYPGFPATQPLGVPLELSQAAHLILADPVYLCGGGRVEMWITRADAPPVESVLADAVDPDKDVDVHVLRQRVAFVHWMPVDEGPWPPYLVCENGKDRFEVISSAYGHQPLPTRRGYHWNHAMSWNDKVVVPTEHGVSIFRMGKQISESYKKLSHAEPATQPVHYSEPQFLLDQQGLLAWLPWEPGKTGGLGAARYIEPAADEKTGVKPEAKWTDLTPQNGWPAKILHLVPLLDGTVLMLTVDENDAVQVQYNTLEHAAVDEKAVEILVGDLSDPDQKIRDAANDKLSQYGSGIWPILERLLENQDPEAQSRMRQLLKQKVVPTLNGMALLGSKTLSLAARLADGGTVFYAQAGVSIPKPQDPDAEPDYRVPAWISIRPGHPIELLPESFTTDLTSGGSVLYANGNDWIVTNDIRGPRRFVGNGFVTLLRKSEHGFSEFVGVDRRGRWIFRKPLAAASTTAPSTTQSSPEGQTLIVDPTLPDVIPRLPVWVLNSADEVGWTKDGWPVTRRKSAYALHEESWQLVDEKEQIFEKPEDVPPPVELSPATAPSTQPATQMASAATRPSAPMTTSTTTSPTTNAATQPGETPILTDRDGTRYFGGLTDLRLIPLKGPPITWILPALANGKGPVWLIRTPDGCLYLFNQPGRVVRIKPTPGHAEPFAMEKIFTHRIPTVDHPTRIWLDPAGRIVMAWENQLAILFPAGYIPKPIADMMVSVEQDDDD